MRKSRDGYTLVELMLVMAILLILTALAYPTLSGLAGNKGLTGKRGQTAALDELRSKVAQARARAMSDQVPYRLAVIPGKGNYRLAPDTDENWGQGGSAASAPTPAGTKPLVYAGALPQGSCFFDPEGAPAEINPDQETSSDPDQVSSSAYQSLVTFLPNGTAQDGGKIGVKTAEARPVVVTFQAATGLVSVQEQ